MLQLFIRIAVCEAFLFVTLDGGKREGFFFEKFMNLGGEIAETLKNIKLHFFYRFMVVW